MQGDSHQKKFNLPLKIIHYKKNIVANWDKSTILFKKENSFESILLSFPTRERGLKCSEDQSTVIHLLVVPHAGTWIEIAHSPTLL